MLRRFFIFSYCGPLLVPCFAESSRKYLPILVPHQVSEPTIVVDHLIRGHRRPPLSLCPRCCTGFAVWGLGFGVLGLPRGWYAGCLVAARASCPWSMAWKAMRLRSGGVVGSRPLSVRERVMFRAGRWRWHNGCKGVGAWLSAGRMPAVLRRHSVCNGVGARDLGKEINLDRIYQIDMIWAAKLVECHFR